jgi:hypothetical protein
MGVLLSVYSVNVIFDSPVCTREFRNSQPPTPGRAINLILALPVAIGDGGLFYVYFLTATPNGWMALAA